MYIPLIVFVILFLIQPTLALDLLLICAAVYYWQIAVPILIVLFLIYSCAENK